MSVSGELKDREDFSPIFVDEAPAVHAVATDGGSGVLRVAVQVDRAQRAAAEATELDFTYLPSDYPDGTHTVRITAVDGAGNEGAVQWEIFQNTAPPGSPGEEELDAAEDPPSEQGTTTSDASASAGPSSDLASPDAGSSHAQDGVVLDDQTPSAPTTVQALATESLPCTSASEVPNFDRFWLGESFEGLPLTHVLRRCDVPDPRYPVHANFVSYIYGDCEPDLTDEHPSCNYPIEIQSWAACERNLSKYSLGPGLGPPPYGEAVIQGVPAAIFDEGFSVEVYTAKSTVAVFGQYHEQIRRAAEAMEGVSRSTPLDELPIPANDPGVLPDPVPGALEGQLPC